MIRKSRTPKHLAKKVVSELRNLKIKPPKLKVMTEILDVLFFASLKREEGKYFQCTIVYLDPNNIDPKPPERIRDDRWNAVAFKAEMPFTTKNLAKVSKATGKSASLIGVYSKDEKLYIWGLIDQLNRYDDFINRESESGPEIPGIFQARIVDTGNISVYVSYKLIANLRQNELIDKYFDVFRYGPIATLIRNHIDKSVKKPDFKLPKDSPITEKEYAEELFYNWKNSLCRILLNIQNFRHGGALLITPDKELKNLKPKHEIYYKRLHKAMIKISKKKEEEDMIQAYINENYIEKREEEMPIGLYFGEVIAVEEIREISDEITGCIRFISSLSQIDGCVLMDRDLIVKGFGVEIMATKEPKKISLAESNIGRSKKKISYEQFGTRHRSMMKYCYQNIGSIGIVISQDGEIRAMTKVGNSLVLWENIKLQLSS